MNASIRRWLIPATLLTLTLLAYANSLHGPFVYDDLPAISRNPTLRPGTSWHDVLLPPLDGGVSVSGRPLLNLSFALNARISGSAVWSYHLLNLLIHTAAGLTLYGVLRRTLLRLRGPTPSPEAGASSGRGTAFAKPEFLAGAIAGLWLLHPLQTESVTYLIQRAESLMGLCYLFTLYAFIRSVDESKPRWQVASVVACALGMATKEVMITAPVLVLLYDRTFLAGSFRGACLSRPGYYLGLAATWLLLLGLVFNTGGNRGGSIGAEVGVSAWAYGLTQFPALFRYLALAVWPHPLVFEYGKFWISDVAVIVPDIALVSALLLGTVYALWRAPRWGFLGAWCFIILAPTSLAPGTTQMIVEHRMYLPLAAVLIGCAWLLHRFLPRLSWVIGSIVLLGFGGLTAVRNHDYRSATALWSDTVAKRPHNAVARENLGEALLNEGRLDEAIRSFQSALELTPDDPLLRYNLGCALARVGRFRDAAEHYEAALRVHPADSALHTNLAIALAEMGRLTDAEIHAALAVRLRPQDPETHRNHSLHLIHLHREAEAKAELETALRLRPEYVDARAELASLLLRKGDINGAIAQAEAALRVDPNSLFAHHALGLALERLGRAPEAKMHYEAVLKLAPADAIAHAALGRLLLESNEPETARIHLAAAAKTQPADFETNADLGQALAKLNRTTEAITAYQRAVALNPAAADVWLNLGNALYRVDRLQEAVEAYQQTRRLDPSNPKLRLYLAATLLRLGRADDALACYFENLQMAPNDAIAHAELANALAYLGRRTEAIAHYETALRINPGLEAVRQQLSRLRSTP